MKWIAWLKIEEGRMAPIENSTAGKRAYIAPSLERMPIGATAASNLPNADIDNGPSGTAFGQHGS